MSIRPCDDHDCDDCIRYRRSCDARVTSNLLSHVPRKTAQSLRGGDAATSGRRRCRNKSRLPVDFRETIRCVTFHIAKGLPADF